MLRKNRSTDSTEFLYRTDVNLVVLVINSRGLGFYFNFVGERTYEPFVPTVIGLLKCRNKGGFFCVGCLKVGGRQMVNSAKLLVTLPSFCFDGYFGISGTLRYLGG